MPPRPPPVIASPPPLPPADGVASSRATSQIHIGCATGEDEPFGLLSLVNSTAFHCSEPSSLRFHVIVPAGSRRRLRLLLESLFPALSFRMYSLDAGGVRAKILRHLRRREREPVFVSPFGYAVAYLPILVPSVQRLLWLHTDVLVLSDVKPIFDAEMRGAPAAAVEDCAAPSSDVFNRSHVAVRGAVPPGACAFDSSVMLVDLLQWSLLDVTSRVEYWLSLNLRPSDLMPHNDAHAPLVLALLPVYARLPPAWALGELGRRRARAGEDARTRSLLAAAGAAASATAAGAVATAAAGGARRLVVLAVGGPASPAEPARAVHFSGKWKPWLRGASGPSSALCLRASPGVQDAPVGGGEGADEGRRWEALPCASLWSAYALRAVRTLGWRLPTAAEAAQAALSATAAAVAGSAEEAEPPGIASLESDPAVQPASGGGVAAHVTVVSNDAAPYGLVALINSTLRHASPASRSLLHFRVVARAELHERTSRQLASIFDSQVRVTTVMPPADRLTKLAAQLAALGVTADPFDLPQLWLPHALPSDVPRTLLLADDTLVLTDVGEIYAAALRGKAAAVVEDCAVLFESLFNYRHALFEKKHARSSCTFDASTLLIDTEAWRRDDVSGRILDLMGSQRKTDGLYLQANLAADVAAPALLALDRRVLRLPSRWLARGLARESFTHSELTYWRRFWGQQGVRLPLTARPYRAVQATPLPSRSAGDALLLRFSGGPFKPWLRRCSAASAASVPLCGRSQSDCARSWWRHFSPSLVPLLEATEADASGALRVRRAAQRACLPEPQFAPSGVATPTAIDADAAASTGPEASSAADAPAAAAPPAAAAKRTVKRKSAKAKTASA